MTRYATNIENDGGCPDCDSYERKIDRMNAKMADLEAQISSKEQELQKANDFIEKIRYREDEHLEIQQQQYNAYQQDLKEKEQECEELKISVNNFTEMYQDKCNELASLRAERDKWREDCIHNANRGLEIVAERDTLRKRCEDLEAAIKTVCEGSEFMKKIFDKLLIH